MLHIIELHSCLNVTILCGMHSLDCLVLFCALKTFWNKKQSNDPAFVWSVYYINNNNICFSLSQWKGRKEKRGQPNRPQSHLLQQEAAVPWSAVVFIGTSCSGEVIFQHVLKKAWIDANHLPIFFYVSKCWDTGIVEFSNTFTFIYLTFITVLFEPFHL